MLKSTHYRILMAALSLTLAITGDIKSAPILSEAIVHTTDRFASNPLSSLPSGDFIQISLQVAAASTSDPFETLDVVATRGDEIVPLEYFPYTVGLPDPVYLAFVAFDGASTEAWSITATDSTGTSAPALSSPLIDPKLIPFATGVTVSDNSTTPTLSWTLPDTTGLSDDAFHVLEVRIIDLATENQIFNGLQSITDPAQFIVPDGILNRGESYIYRIGVAEYVFNDSDFFVVTNRSNAFSSVVQVVPEPGSLGLSLLGLAMVGAWHRRKRFRRNARLQNHESESLHIHGRIPPQLHTPVCVKV